MTDGWVGTRPAGDCPQDATPQDAPLPKRLTAVSTTTAGGPPPHRLRGFRTGLLLLLPAALIGGSSDTSPTVLEQPAGPVTIGMTASHPRTPYLFGLDMVCLSRAGDPARITSITTVDAEGGLQVDAFAVRPNPFPRGEMGFGGDTGTLTDYTAGRGTVAGLDPAGPQMVSGACTRDATDESELVVQVSKPGTTTASTHGLVVHYVLDHSGRTGATLLPGTITLSQ